MGIFNSKIQDDESLKKAFGDFPTGVSREQASELWKRYDENGDGRLSKVEAKHMVIDLAELTVSWAKSNINEVLAAAYYDSEIDTRKLVTENEEKIDAAYTMMKDESVINKILGDFDVDADGQVDREEFLLKACEGYDILSACPPPSKRQRTEPKGLDHILKHIQDRIVIDGSEFLVHRDCVGNNIYVTVDGLRASENEETERCECGNNFLDDSLFCRQCGVARPGPRLPLCSASISCSGIVCISGQSGIVPGEGVHEEGGAGPETIRSLENISHILVACGLTLDNLVKINIFVKDTGGQLNIVDKHYREFFCRQGPSLSTSERDWIQCSTRRRPCGDKRCSFALVLSAAD